MDRMLVPLLASHPGLTGIRPLLGGEDAFAARLALIEAAERRIDAQYYIFRDDLTGRVLLDALSRAAARGVRVRLLLDDHNTPGMDRLLAELDAHPGIEVRLFNPFSRRFARIFGLLTDFTRLNRRMHNKSLTADGVVTVIGGRNVGDEYFAATRELGFIDLDVLAIGPAALEVAAAFEVYWSSAASVPARRVLRSQRRARRAAPFVAELAAVRRREAAGYLDTLRRNPLSHFVAAHHFEWAEAKLVVDPPAKIWGRAARREYVLDKLQTAFDGEIRRELVIVSPYFVPGPAGTKVLTTLVSRGVRVRVLTNALESTDVLAVHAGYARHRHALLVGGVELFELRRAALGTVIPHTAHQLGSHASLHAKVFAVDGERLCIGSFNFDWRSAFFNTELGLVLRSPLAATLATAFDEVVPRAAYAVTLGDDGRINWQVRGHPQAHHREPGTTFVQRCLIGLLRLLPVEAML